MPLNLSHLNPEQLKKYVRHVSAGEMLFQQNDLGNTMFVIVSGTLTLLETRGEAQFVVGSLAIGQVLGEKALLTESPYRRTYSARAEENSTLLEFDNKHLKLIEAIVPNFTSRILSIAAKRLDRANSIISLLRSLDPVERVVNTLLFLAEDAPKAGTGGLEIEATPEDINQVCHVPMPIIQDCLKLLYSAKILHATKKGILITDVNALRQYFPELKERVAA